MRVTAWSEYPITIVRMANGLRQYRSVQVLFENGVLGMQNFSHLVLVCPPPPRSSNEFVQELGSVATYICSDRELVMYGDSSITCNALTKKWSKSKRSCVPSKVSNFF